MKIVLLSFFLFGLLVLPTHCQE
uniref:Uncharacterized protein n=1 Tax=Anguilla anguilla TaxID=7936 RepID=A0A0E9XF80_ANGAN